MIYILPGMGADSAMFAGPWRNLPHAVFLDWPKYAGEKSLPQMARRVVDECGIEDGSVLVGASVGGMVACEVAGLRKLGGLVLVGSAKRKEEISGLLTILHPLAKLAPMEFMQQLAGKVPSELAQMFNRSQAQFVREMCQAVFAWQGLDERLIKPLRIHGRNDRVIPLPQDVQKVVEGGHLIAMTHAEICVAFIQTHLEDLAEQP